MAVEKYKPTPVQTPSEPHKRTKTSEEIVLMRDYLERFERRSTTLIVVTVIVFSLFMTIVLALCRVVAFVSVEFFAVWALVGTTTIMAAFALFWWLGQPFRDIIRQVIVISGDPTTLTPPNPNARRYAVDGFKQILQTVYELSTKHDEPAPPPEKPKENNEPLRIGLDNSPAGIIIMNHARKIIYSNAKAPVAPDADGKTAIEALFLPSESLEDWLDQCDENAVHASRYWSRIPNRPAGEHGRRLYDIVASYQKGSSAEITLIFVDRTKDYNPEEEELEFVSFAAHELRGPITVIRGYLDVLSSELQPVLKNDQAQLLQRLIVSSNRLSSYVNNILNASRYDRRHFKVHLGEETLTNIYSGIKDDMQLRAVSQNRLLIVNLPDNLPTVAADISSIGEVLSNLIDNAIKYSNEGGQVVVTAHTIPGFVEITITDHGIGIPAAIIPNLFHKFYRSHRSRETVAGTGIGLYITKAIVESHGGTIEVRSTERAGSTFTFTLPIYDTVADKIKSGDNTKGLLVEHGGGWIRNHSMFRG